MASRRPSALVSKLEESGLHRHDAVSQPSGALGDGRTKSSQRIASAAKGPEPESRPGDLRGSHSEFHETAAKGRSRGIRQGARQAPAGAPSRRSQAQRRPPGRDRQRGNRGASVKRGDAEYQPHHSILWMAGGAEGFKDVELRPAPGRQWLSSEEICSFLTSLPKKFMKAGSNEPAPGFISFAFGYDVGQIVRDMPYEKAWELMHGLPWKAAWSLVDGKWRRKERPTSEPNFNRSVYWKGFTLSYRPRKSITIARLKDRNNPSRPVKRKGADHVSLETQFEPGTRIQIYDTFHFFQMSFLKALSGSPKTSLLRKKRKSSPPARRTGAGSKLKISKRSPAIRVWS